MSLFLSGKRVWSFGRKESWSVRIRTHSGVSGWNLIHILIVLLKVSCLLLGDPSWIPCRGYSSPASSRDGRYANSTGDGQRSSGGGGLISHPSGDGQSSSGRSGRYLSSIRRRSPLPRLLVVGDVHLLEIDDTKIASLNLSYWQEIENI